MKKIKNKRLKFYSLGLAGTAGRYYFDNPKNKDEGSYKLSKAETRNFFEGVSVSDFFKKNNHEKIDILKIDIEGFEYDDLEDILENNIPINQIVLEFHHHFKEIPILRTLRYIIKLKKAGYKLIYKRIDDFTFIKK